MDARDGGAVITPKQIAELLNNSEYPLEFLEHKTLEKQAAANEIVIAWGDSDDRLEFAGAISDELSAWGGTEFFLNARGLITNDCNDEDCPYFAKVLQKAVVGKLLWCENRPSRPPWTFDVPFPCERFMIIEDGEPQSEGIVFKLSDVAALQQRSAGVGDE